MSAPDLKAPPARAGYWTFALAGDDMPRMFHGKTWFEARAKACAFAGCEPGDVVCVGRPV